jgi:hypothetical protein
MFTAIKEGEILAGAKKRRICVDFVGPIAPHLHYQGKSRCLSAPIHDFMLLVDLSLWYEFESGS